MAWASARHAPASSRAGHALSSYFVSRGSAPCPAIIRRAYASSCAAATIDAHSAWPRKPSIATSSGVLLRTVKAARSRAPPRLLLCAPGLAARGAAAARAPGGGGSKETLESQWPALRRARSAASATRSAAIIRCTVLGWASVVRTAKPTPVAEPERPCAHLRRVTVRVRAVLGPACVRASAGTRVLTQRPNQEFRRGQGEGGVSSMFINGTCSTSKWSGADLAQSTAAGSARGGTTDPSSPRCVYVQARPTVRCECALVQHALEGDQPTNQPIDRGSCEPWPA